LNVFQDDGQAMLSVPEALIKFDQPEGNIFKLDHTSNISYKLNLCGYEPPETDMETVVAGSVAVTDVRTYLPNQKWIKKHSLYIIKLFVRFDSLLKARKILSKTDMWKRMAAAMLIEIKVSVTATQVESKWKSLKRAYVSAIDHNRRSGRDTKTCPFRR
jgi:hypothetical protein